MTTIMGRILESIAARGSIDDWLGDIEGTPDEFVQEAEPIEDDDDSISDAIEVQNRAARKIEAIG